MVNASGIGTYIKNLLPLIIDNLSSYVSFNILGSLDELDHFRFLKKKNINLINFTNPIYSIQEQINYVRVIPKETDLFWSPHYNFPIFHKGKLLVSIMDLGHLALKEINHELSKRLYASFMFNQVKKKADATVYISQFSMDEFNRIIGKPNTSQTITHLGVDQSWFYIPRHQNGVKKPYLLYVGNVKPHKNLRSLIEVFGKVCNKIPHNLMIVGKKEGFITGDETLFSIEGNYLDRITFTGKVSDNELKKYVVQADVFIFPSIYEGFGLPPLEAMAAGTPVVSSNAASIPEICGNAALYFDPYNVDEMAEKILQMLNNKTLREEYIERGKERAKLFKWEKTAKQSVLVIENMLEG
jgi:glycosyltransferase involved in cell wall biosynthesis